MSKHEHHHGHHHGHDHGHDHDHGDHSGSMPVYQFLGNILGFPLDETLLYNVTDPAFWAERREALENELTHDALDHIEAAVAVLDTIPDESRMMIMQLEFARAFLGPDAPMLPVERDYGMPGEQVREAARAMGVDANLQRYLPADHIANELFMLVPLDYFNNPSEEQLKTLADFFMTHTIPLLENMLAHSEGDTDDSGFYRAIVELTLAWMKWDIAAYEG